MIKRILFATDLGVLSSHSLVHVESLARSFSAKVFVVHAVPPLAEFAAAVVRSQCSEPVKSEVLGTPHIKGLLEAMRAEIYTLLSHEPWAEADYHSLIGDVIVAAGQPAAVILQQAETTQADLIVIGNHSTDALDSRLLGSVASKVLQLAKVPVFMIPQLDVAKYAQEAASGMKAPQWR